MIADLGDDLVAPDPEHADSPVVGRGADADMQDTAIEFTLLSINEKNTEQDTATAIKQKIETKYPGV